LYIDRERGGAGARPQFADWYGEAAMGPQGERQAAAARAAGGRGVATVPVATPTSTSSTT